MSACPPQTAVMVAPAGVAVVVAGIAGSYSHLGPEAAEGQVVRIHPAHSAGRVGSDRNFGHSIDPADLAAAFLDPV